MPPRAPAPLAAGGAAELLWQFLALVALALGANYLRWRWLHALNPDVPWFAWPLALAETLAWSGLASTVFQCWGTGDPPPGDPPRSPAEAGAAGTGALAVDVLIAVADQPIARVRVVLRAALRLSYPHPLQLRVHLVDRGARAELARLAAEEGARSADSEDAALALASGDFVLLCDGHTRLFPRLLEHTLGYFRDPRVGWVQTPLWFEDLPAGVPLPQWLQQRAGAFGRWLGAGLQELVGPVRIGQDPFGCDPQAFFGIVLRRRSRFGDLDWRGAGAVLRREAWRPARAWRSVLHPSVQSASLAPADFATALELHGRQRLPARALPQPQPQPQAASAYERLMRRGRSWNAFACAWNLVFLLAPLVYLFTGIAPVAGYTSAFYLHLLPFLLALQLAFVVTTWGAATAKARAFRLALAPQQLRALWQALRGLQPARQERRPLRLVAPQLALVALTLAGWAVALWRVFVFGQGQELPALIVNCAWSVYNLVALLAPVRAALWRPPAVARRVDEPAAA